MLAFVVGLGGGAAALGGPARVTRVVEPEAHLGQPLTLRVANAPCPSVLFLDGSPLRGLTPRCAAGTITFPLQVTDANAAAWRAILSSPPGLTRRVTVAIGPNEQQSWPTDVHALPLRVIAWWELLLIALAIAILFAALVVVRRRTTLLGTLARMQVAFWLAVIAAAYVAIWCVTGELRTIDPSALALLGIGAGTIFGDAILKSGKGGPVDVKAIAEAAKAGGVAMPAEQQQPWNFHTFQMLVWTLLLGLVFAVSVYDKLQMPDFGASLLALLGISNGTYLALAFARTK